MAASFPHDDRSMRERMLAGELYMQAFASTYGLETVRLRFFNIFGPRQRADSPYSGVIALFVAALTAGRQPTIYDDGLQSRDFTYVTDVVQALTRAAEAPGASGRVYNVRTGRSVRARTRLSPGPSVPTGASTVAALLACSSAGSTRTCSWTFSAGPVPGLLTFT